jgi:hypothetical protein|tara:strand:+ start:305 stop:664 length:360 start_codon:yes stop_codon:yes gene_type:complete
MIGVKDFPQWITANCTAIARNNSKKLPLTPSEIPTHRAIQYSVIVSSLYGRSSGTEHWTNLFIRTIILAIGTRFDSILNPSFRIRVSSAFGFCTPNKSNASSNEAGFPSSMCSRSAKEG